MKRNMNLIYLDGEFLYGNSEKIGIRGIFVGP